MRQNSITQAGVAPIAASLAAEQTSVVEAFINKNYYRLLAAARDVIKAFRREILLEASDLLHEVGTKIVALEKTGKPFTERGLWTYLVKSMRNFLVDITRSPEKKAQYYAADELSDYKLEALEAHPAAVEDEDLLQKMHEIKCHLSGFRGIESSVFLLRYSNGCSIFTEKVLTFAEIGNILGKKMDTVKTVHFHTLKKLRKLLST